MYVDYAMTTTSIPVAPFALRLTCINVLLFYLNDGLLKYIQSTKPINQKEYGSYQNYDKRKHTISGKKCISSLTTTLVCGRVRK